MNKGKNRVGSRKVTKKIQNVWTEEELQEAMDKLISIPGSSIRGVAKNTELMRVPFYDRNFDDVIEQAAELPAVDVMPSTSAATPATAGSSRTPAATSGTPAAASGTATVASATTPTVSAATAKEFPMDNIKRHLGSYQCNPPDGFQWVPKWCLEPLHYQSTPSQQPSCSKSFEDLFLDKVKGPVNKPNVKRRKLDLRSKVNNSLSRLSKLLNKSANYRIA